MKEIIKNLYSDTTFQFELLNTAGSFVPNMRTQLDTNTVFLYYFTSSGWITATLTGLTIIEVGGDNTTGIYEMTIDKDWFTSTRYQNYPVIIKIKDDAGTPQWVDTGVVINSVINAESIWLNGNDNGRIPLQITTYKGTNNAIFIQKQGTGSAGAVSIDGLTGDAAIEILAANIGVSINPGSSVFKFDWAKKIFEITNLQESGIKITNAGNNNAILEVEEKSGSTDIQLIKVNNRSSSPLIDIENIGTGQVTNLECSSPDPAVKINNTGSGKDIDATELSNLLKSTDTIDGTTVENLLSILKAFCIGRYKKDTPSQGQLTVYQNDNVTPLAIVTLTDTERTRDLPV